MGGRPDFPEGDGPSWWLGLGGSTCDQLGMVAPESLQWGLKSCAHPKTFIAPSCTEDCVSVAPVSSRRGLEKGWWDRMGGGLILLCISITMTIEPELFVLATIVATTAESVGQRQVSQDGPRLGSWGALFFFSHLYFPVHRSGAFGRGHDCGPDCVALNTSR